MVWKQQPSKLTSSCGILYWVRTILFNIYVEYMQMKLSNSILLKNWNYRILPVTAIPVTSQEGTAHTHTSTGLFSWLWPPARALKHQTIVQKGIDSGKFWGDVFMTYIKLHTLVFYSAMTTHIRKRLSLHKDRLFLSRSLLQTWAHSYHRQSNSFFLFSHSCTSWTQTMR